MSNVSAALRRHARLSLTLGLASFAVVTGLTGCGAGTTASPSPLTSLSVAGHVFGGQQAVTGSHVALFVTSSSGTGGASATGYGGAATQLAHATTDGNGDFSITTSYNCPANQFAYLVATGGNPGLTSADNSAIFLMAALGPCNNSTLAGDIVNINEVTTVAAAYALSGFLPAGGAGMTEAAVIATADNGTMPGVTTSSTNTQGLTDAFANAANIVNFTTGLAYTVTPSNTSGVVPQAVIHALADILQTCVNTAGPSDALCTGTSPMGVLTAATPPSGTTPANVFQAALNIAQYPSNNVSALWGMKSSSPAFPTTLTSAPNDWTVALAYTNSTLVSTSALGISAADNVYVGGTGYLINFTGQGAPINTTNLLTGVPSGDAVRYMEFDSAGNLFFADGNKASTDTKIYEVSSGGTTTALNYGTVSTNANTYNLAIDSLGDVWTPNYSKATCSSVGCNLIEFAKGSSSYTPYASFSSFTVPQPTGAVGGARGIAYDVNTNNVWITAIDDNLGELFRPTPVSGAVATATAGPIQITGLGTEVAAPTSSTTCGTISVAVDKNAAGWFLTSGGTSANCGSTTAAALNKVAGNITSTTAGTAVDVSTAGLVAPTQLVIDGNNNIFIANQGGGSVVEYNTTLGAVESGSLGFIPVAVDTAHSMYQPQYLEVDRAGALWTSSTGSGSSTKPANLIQILGVAAPTNPVQPAGQYGVKP